MGGDTISHPSSSIDDEQEQSTIKAQFPDRFGEIPTPTSWYAGGFSGEETEEKESVFGESDAASFRDFCKTLEIEANERRICSVYAQVNKNYDELKNRTVNLELAKSKILSYTPGSWIENVGGMTVSDYNVPKTTTLVLIGQKGCGKSSLINRISRVFEDDKFAPERAQVTYDSSIHDGTSFLREYMIPRSSTNFCLYDTCGFSNDLSENLDMIRQWMTKGVCHGQLMKSASHNSSLQSRVKCKSRQDKPKTYERRRVGFVIFVVNGLSVLKCMDNNGADTQYTQMVARLFSSPYLSFQDHKPVIAITHGDLLSLSERARVRVYLGQLLGVHPSTHTFDIPDNCEPTTELTIVDLVRYALEHADRNLPCKSQPVISKGSTIQGWSNLLLLLAVGIFIFTVHLHGFHSLKLHQGSVPQPNLEIKKVMEGHQESIPEQGLETNKAHQQNVPKPNLEIKEVMAETVPQPNPEIKKVTDFHQERFPVQDQDTKQAHQENVPELNLEIKKFIAESISKPNLERKVHAERILEKARKKKKVGARRVPEPSLEIDWKKIRHLWYK